VPKPSNILRDEGREDMEDSLDQSVVRGSSESRSGGSARAEKIGDGGMIAFRGQGDGGLALIAHGSGIRATSEEQFQDFEMAIGGRGEEGRIARAIAVIGIKAALEKKFDDVGVAGGNRGGEGIVTGAVGGSGVDVGTFVGKISRGVQMAKETSESENREAIGGKRTGGGGIGLHKVTDALEVASRRSLREIHLEAPRKEEIANVAPAEINGH